MLAETVLIGGDGNGGIEPILDVANQTGNLAVWLIQSALGKSIL